MVKLITLCDSSVVLVLHCIEKVLININYAGLRTYFDYIGIMRKKSVKNIECYFLLILIIFKNF